MSLENEDCSSSDKAIEASEKMLRHSRISYTRDFLLSFSESEVCKKLPLGFDESILSEFTDASSSIQDRQRTYGSTSLQGPRRPEHGSSPPTRGELGTYSRGVYGRWDNRSSGRNDRGLDSQSDKDSDLGRRFGSQSRQSWQGPEHDGLLGSGSFPRASGFGGGISAPKNHPNDQNQLNKSNEPYHPPRPYKAAPLPRRDTRDSFNDETFGSNEITSEDRAEDERRRRASFEFTRKEQQKAIQEKQRVNMNNHTTDSVSGISEILNDGKEGKNVSGNSELESDTTSMNLGKSSLPSQTCRPLVPPGFTNLATEKDSGFKAIVCSDSSEVGKNKAEECLVQKAVVQNGTSVPKTSSSNGIVGDQLFFPFLTKGEQNTNSSSSLDGSRESSGIEDSKNQIPIASEACDVSGMVELNSGLSGVSLDGEFNNKVLEQILGDALAVNVSNSTYTIEICGDKADDNHTLNAPRSSKFARWFVEEETTAITNDISSTSPKDLLSLLVGTNSNKPKLNDSVYDNHNKDLDPLTREISSPFGSEVLSSKTITAPEPSEPRSLNQEVVVVQNVLTCEDLEQTILSEYRGPGSEGGGGTVTDTKSERLKPHTDDHASHHLLSLLQIGPTNSSPPKALTDTKRPGSNLRSESVEEEEEGKNIQQPGKILTLENLFGTAFMKELQSVEAPVSIHRGGSGGSPRDVVGLEDVEAFLTSNHGQKTRPDKKTDKWMGYDDPVIDLNLSIKSHVHRATDYQLPEKENLISALNPDLKSRFLNQFETGDNIQIVKNSRPDIGVGSSFLNGPFIKHLERNNLSRDLHAQTSTSNNFQSMHMNIQRLDPHSAHTSPRGMVIQNDVSSNQQFPSTNIMRSSFRHHPSMVVDRAAHHHPMLEQLQMQKQLEMQRQTKLHGDYPPHLVNDFQRGNLVPPQQGYPFGHGQSNVGGRGIPVAGPDVNGGRRNPEAFQRLLEMELRANSKRIPPFPRWQ